MEASVRIQVHEDRVVALQRDLADVDIAAVLITCSDSIYYLTGYVGYLDVEFGRLDVTACARGR